MNAIDGFTLVTKKHKLRSKRKTTLGKSVPLNIPPSSTVVDLQLISKIDELSRWNFYHDLKNYLVSRLASKKIDLVCYGLGNFSQCYRSQYQLALLNCLVEILKSVGTLVSSEIYDPLFNESEIVWLKKNGYKVLETNEVGQKSVSMETVFYMPHCGRPLYNNVLYSNWNCDQLKNVCIIGNSFQKFKENIVFKREFETYRYLYEASNFCNELVFAPFVPTPDAFNDLSVHYFENSLSLSNRDSIEPSYDSDCEIII